MQNNVGKYSISLGDRVQHLDELIEGEVVDFHYKTVTIQDDDGFEYQFEITKLILLPGKRDRDDLRNAVFSGPIRSKEEGNKPKITVKRDKGRPAVPEFDLHFEKMLDHYPDLDKNNALDFQLSYAKTQLDQAIKNRLPKIVLIHGVGEGVLKQELLKLIKQYDHLDPQPANPRKYGTGATLVYIRQQ